MTRRPKRKRLPDDQRLDVYVRAETWKAVDDASHDKGLTMGQIVEEAVRKHLGLDPLPRTPEEGYKGGMVCALA